MYLTRNILAIAFATLGFLGAAKLAHGAGDPTATKCTRTTTVRADGAIVTHRVCTYTLRSAR